MIEIIITSSVLILALVLIRKIFWGKISRRLQYGLWILVVVRLLIPASLFTSSLSIMNVADDVSEAANAKWQSIHIGKEITQSEDYEENDDFLQEGTTVIGTDQKIQEMSQVKEEQHGGGAVNESNGPTDPQPLIDNQAYVQNSVLQENSMLQGSDMLQNPSLPPILLIIYILGVLITGSCILLCNLKFRKLLNADKQFLGKEGQLNVYLSFCISSPCLWGIVRPSIYLTEKSLVPPERKKYILLHEMTHYRHLDHIWAVVRITCLVLYWFHPLVWVAARLSMEDGELACDEGTFVRLGAEKRDAYGRTLIEMMTEPEKKRQLLYCTTGMINSKEEIRRRITAIAFYKKRVIWTAIPVIALAVVLSACTAGREKGPDNQTEAENVGVSEKEEFGEENGSTFRLAEYEVDLTGDDVKEKIVFEVTFSEELEVDDSTITNQMLWEKLWHGSEVSVKILEGKDAQTQDTDAEEIILAEYSFSEVHACNGNLAIVKVDGQNCIMRYDNLMDQGIGTFSYEISQILSSGAEPAIIEEMSASYADPKTGENNREVIDQVLLVGGKLDQYLAGSGTQILLSASVDPEKCYLYGSRNGLYDKGRRQSAFVVFMTEVGGSGLELKLEDYFYPNGMEPLTRLPEDAEDRILAGEILYMEVNRENGTAGKIDLNGDGEKEVLYLEALGPYYNGNAWNDWNRINSNFRVRINEQYYESSGSNVEPVLMAFSPDGEQILLAVYDDGPSSDPLTSFFRYDERGVYAAGKIYDDLRTVSINEEGVIACTFRADMIQTEWAWNYYEWNGSEMVRREDEIYYYVDDSQWRERDQIPLLLLRELTVFAERSESSEAIVMKPQKVRNVATDGVEWILLEAEDGTRGWIRKVNGRFASEDAEIAELFEGRILMD